MLFDSLLGSVKQLRGFGSQHFATVNVTELKRRREIAQLKSLRVPKEDQLVGGF